MEAERRRRLSFPTSPKSSGINTPRQRFGSNVEGLASALCRQGHITKPTAFQDFVKGFNDAAELVSFVDVGYGKELADVKIKSTPSTHDD